MAGDLLGRGAQHSGDAEAALGDAAVGGAEDIAAVGEPQQHLLDGVIGWDGRRGELLALEGHGSPIGRPRQLLSDVAR